MFGWVGWRVEVMRVQEWRDAIRDGAGADGSCGTTESTPPRHKTQTPSDDSRSCCEMLLLVGAAVRTADAIDRVQGREQNEHHGGDEPSHTLIMHPLCARRAGVRVHAERPPAKHTNSIPG